MMGLFEPRNREPKGKGGKVLVGFWATRDEHSKIRVLAADRGHSNVADYFRTLIRDDLRENGDPE